MVSSNFHSALLKAIAQSDLGFFKKAQLRLALRKQENLEEAQQMCYEAAVEQGVVDGTMSIQAINWEGLTKFFIEVIIPLLLELLKLLPKS